MNVFIPENLRDYHGTFNVADVSQSCLILSPTKICQRFPSSSDIQRLRQRMRIILRKRSKRKLAGRGLFLYGVNFANLLLLSANILLHSIWYQQCHSLSPHSAYYQLHFTLVLHAQGLIPKKECASVVHK